MTVVEVVEVGVKVTEHDPERSVQDGPIEPLPPLRAKETVPVGVPLVPAEVSNTDAVQVVATFSVGVPQLTDVEVARFDVETVSCELVLVLYVPLPE